VKKLIAALLATLLLASAAAAAISVDIKQVGVMGNLRYVIADFDLDSSYRNGGESVTAANFGLTNIIAITFTPQVDGYVLHYDYTNSKVVVYAVQDSIHAALYGAMADVAPDTNAVDLSGVTDIRVFALGH